MRPRLSMLLALVLLSAAALQAQDTPTDDREAVARAYLKTLETMDWEGQASFYTEKSVFEDPTAIYFGTPWRFEGPEAIVGLWRSSTEDSGTLEIRHAIHRLFVTGPYVVIDHASTVRLTGAMIGFPEREIEGTIEVSTVLLIQKGKVLHHLDHADYETAWAELEAFKRRFEAEAEEADGEAEDAPAEADVEAGHRESAPGAPAPG